uniref:Uncharacterized protein n=1 Tax=Knipowitschia caucasica TaxID=637954 RepID=A0AAV2KHN5_KNICA
MGVLMTPTDPGAQINGKRIILPLDITFEEWNSGVRRTCLLDHGELLEPLKRVYERKDARVVPAGQGAPTGHCSTLLKRDIQGRMMRFPVIWARVSVGHQHNPSSNPSGQI